MAISLDDVVRQMEEADVGGLTANDLKVDGRYHRFRPEGERRKKKSAWYKFFSMTTQTGREVIVGAYGRGPDTYKLLPSQVSWTLEEREEFKRRHAERERELEKERKQQANTAAEKAQGLWAQFKDRIAAAPYLRRKGVKPFGVRFGWRNSVVIPVRNAAGELRALQWIGEDGSKRFTSSAEIAGNFHLIGQPADDGWIAIGEGYATCASVAMATGLPIAVAFDAGNLAKVASVFRELYPNAKILIVGDDDRHLLKRLDERLARYGVTERPALNGEWHAYETDSGAVSVRVKWGVNHQEVQFIEGEMRAGEKSLKLMIENAGRTKAIITARKVKGHVAFPNFAQGDNSTGTDFNDLHLEQGLDEVKKQIQAVLASPPAVSGKAQKRQQAYGDPEFQAMMDHCVLIYPTKTVWDGRTRQIAPIDAVRLRAKWLTDEWLGHPHRRMILDKNLVFDPTMKCDPVECVNLFDGFSMKPDPQKSCRLILEHLEALCSGDKALLDWLIKWLAYPLQNPGAKMRTALVLHGRMEGSGKSLIFEVMRDIYGRYAQKVSQRQLKSEFTGWMSQLLFCVAEEVTTPYDRYEYAGLLRNLISEPVVQINEKNLPLRQEENFANFVFLSNDLMPLVLQEFDRRYTVIYYDGEHDAAYFKRLGAEIAAGGAAGFLHYLLTYPLGDFDKYTRPYENKARRELIALGMPAEQKFYQLWRVGALDVPYISCRSSDLYHAFSLWCRRNGERFIASSTAFGTAVGKREKKHRKRIFVLNAKREQTYAQQTMVFVIQRKKEEGEYSDDDITADCQKFQKALDSMIENGND